MSIYKATLDDLLLQLYAHNTHNNKHPDYMLWLGAGASVTSGIPTASGVVQDLLRRVYAQRNKLAIEEASTVTDEEIRRWALSHLDWFNPGDMNKSEYAQVMENVHAPPEMRARYLKGLMRNTRPSTGYKYLGMLLSKGVFDTIITTNFDHLIRQAADPTLAIPLIEVNALEQYPTLTPFPDEPRIIRLHGDFWHGNVLNTEGEIEETPIIRYEAVTRLLQAYGLIVVGYSGSDRKIMDKLFETLIDNHNIGRKGVYWCHRKGSFLPSRVARFLDDAPHAYLVEIENLDFDSVMAQIAAQFRLELPSTASLQEQLENVQEQLAVAWDWQALLTQFVDNSFTKTANVQLQKNLIELAKILECVQAILVCINTSSSSWSVAATVNMTIPHGAVHLSEPLLAKLTENQQSTIRFMLGEPAENDPILQGFSKDHVIEIFTVWHDSQLRGFIVFNSAQSIIEHHEIKLVRAAAQLLVIISST